MTIITLWDFNSKKEDNINNNIQYKINSNNKNIW